VGRLRGMKMGIFRRWRGGEGVWERENEVKGGDKQGGGTGTKIKRNKGTWGRSREKGRWDAVKGDGKDALRR